MEICETCGSDYDKTFQVVHNGKAHIFDSFECARSMRWRRPAPIVALASSGTAWRRRERFSVASTAPKPKACMDYAIDCDHFGFRLCSSKQAPILSRGNSR